MCDTGFVIGSTGTYAILAESGYSIPPSNIFIQLTLLEYAGDGLQLVALMVIFGIQFARLFLFKTGVRYRLSPIRFSGHWPRGSSTWQRNCIHGSANVRRAMYIEGDVYGVVTQQVFSVGWLLVKINAWVVQTLVAMSSSPASQH